MRSPHSKPIGLSVHVIRPKAKAALAGEFQRARPRIPDSATESSSRDRWWGAKASEKPVHE